MPDRRQPAIYVDADACPLVAETVRVAERHGLIVHLVANSHRRPASGPLVRLVLVGDGFDAADDWIAERIAPGDIAITADLRLAARCIDRGARVIDQKGRTVTAAAIGGRLAMRDLMADLRAMGRATAGPAPLARADRSRFLSTLETAVQASRRALGDG